ncbi:hypothetical protein HHI36_003342 [Cryptolaemus montrouzieri]|uniref:superoxide dismutase n=1 Tax=Cryptolaemus montrouzieri TaxID=559131 RepID=A0ABD2PDU7_9CUCU
MKLMVSLYGVALSIICSVAFAKVISESSRPVEKAVCVLYNPFNSITGLIHFQKTEEGILITGKIIGLEPGLHAFHIHEKGDIRDPKCSLVGAHFNPYSKKHGAPTDTTRHVGDLGNIYADDNGVALISMTNKLVGLEGPTCVIGRSLVVHRARDDMGRGREFVSKLTGNAGERITCGVIGYA